MAKRAQAMATIDAVLASQAQPKDVTEASPYAIENTEIAPPLPPETPEQKTQREKFETDQKKIQKAREDLLGKEQANEEKKRLAEEEAKQRSLEGIAANVATKTGELLHGGSTRIANLPAPGTIATPLILLILFFFILIQYGGFSRLQWLWLVLTGNAYVLDAANATGNPQGSLSNPNQGGNNSSGNQPIILPQQPTLPVGLTLAIPPNGMSNLSKSGTLDGIFA